MIRSSSKESSPPLNVSVGPRTDTPLAGGDAGARSSDSPRNELPVEGSLCFLNMGVLLATRPVIIGLSLKRTATHLTVPESAGAAQGEIDARLTGERMLGWLQRRNAVVAQAARAAPHDDVAVRERKAQRPIF